MQVTVYGPLKKDAQLTSDAKTYFKEQNYSELFKHLEGVSGKTTKKIIKECIRQTRFENSQQIVGLFKNLVALPNIKQEKVKQLMHACGKSLEDQIAKELKQACSFFNQEKISECLEALVIIGKIGKGIEAIKQCITFSSENICWRLLGSHLIRHNDILKALNLSSINPNFQAFKRILEVIGGIPENQKAQAINLIGTALSSISIYEEDEIILSVCKGLLNRESFLGLELGIQLASRRISPLPDRPKLFSTPSSDPISLFSMKGLLERKWAGVIAKAQSWEELGFLEGSIVPYETVEKICKVMISKSKGELALKAIDLITRSDKERLLLFIGTQSLEFRDQNTAEKAENLLQSKEKKLQIIENPCYTIEDQKIISFLISSDYRSYKEANVLFSKSLNRREVADAIVKVVEREFAVNLVPALETMLKWKYMLMVVGRGDCWKKIITQVPKKILSDFQSYFMRLYLQDYVENNPPL